MAKVESFKVDHTVMTAPQIRPAGQMAGPIGDVVSKFDLRFVKPNSEPIPTGTIHTLEHCLAFLMRDYLSGIVDISPMGCRTGFYLICFGDRTAEEVRIALVSSLERIGLMTISDVPGLSARECGNWKDHDFPSAQSCAKEVLRGLLR